MSERSRHLGRKKKSAVAVSPITRRRTPTPTLSKSQRSSVGVRVTGFSAAKRSGDMGFGYTQTRESRQRRKAATLGESQRPERRLFFYFRLRSPAPTWAWRR